MNILTIPYGSESCYCRPDTTWERENKDLYIPDGVNEIRWAPIAFVRISKAGKCIGSKFASRYYDAFNFGALLYCITDAEDVSPAFTSCFDHTSLLPFPLYDPVVMEGERNIYKVMKNSEEIFTYSSFENIRQKLEDAVCSASRFTSLRIGDFVAVELETVSHFASKEEGEIGFGAEYCGNSLYDIKVKF